MNTEPEPPFYFAMTEICRGVMDAVGARPGEAPERTAGRRRCIADTMSSMAPKDPLETMLAGQCVIFDLTVKDAASDLLGGQPEAFKLRLRPQICAAGRMFLANLAVFQQSRIGAQAKKPTVAPAAPKPVVPAPTPAGPPAVAAAQTPADPPTPARLELMSILERHGMTTADTDNALIAAYRDLPPPVRASGRAATASPPAEPKAVGKVKELA